LEIIYVMQNIILGGVEGHQESSGDAAATDDDDDDDDNYN
jgi:hypothetical protein